MEYVILCNVKRTGIFLLDIRVNWQVYKKDDAPDRVVDFVTYYGRAFPLHDIFGTEITSSSSRALGW